MGWMIRPLPLNLHRSASVCTLDIHRRLRHRLQAYSYSWRTIPHHEYTHHLLEHQLVPFLRNPWSQENDFEMGASAHFSWASVRAPITGTQAFGLTDQQVWEGPDRTLTHLLGALDWEAREEWGCQHLHRCSAPAACLRAWHFRLRAWHFSPRSSSLDGLRY